MDRPARGDDSLLISHDNMTGLGRLAHIVHHEGILRHLEIQINFHPSVMSMAGHGLGYHPLS